MTITPDFIDGIRRLIAGARSHVARGVNLAHVHTNFEIGRRIVDEELKGKDRAAYGEQIIETLAARLTAEFGGFSATNSRCPQPLALSLLRWQFGQSATDESQASSIGQTLAGQSENPPPRPFTLSWTHYVFLLGIKNPGQRSFYEIESAAQNWTVRELRRQFDSGLYERLALRCDKNGIRRLARINSKRQAFVEFVLAQYVKAGVEELDMQKLAPLLALRYHSISDAKLDLGQPEEIRGLYTGFRKYLYEQPPPQNPVHSGA